MESRELIRDMELFSQQLAASIRKHWLPFSLGFIGLIFLVAGLISFFGHNTSRENDISFESGTNFHVEGASDSAQQTIIVDVEGSVLHPGIKTIAVGARIENAIDAAGGFDESADRAWVAKNMNLAAKLTDGAKIYIPNVDESITQLRSSSFDGQASTGLDQGGLININSASTSELNSLSGVGPVTSQKIIDNRPYTNLDELVSKKVVGKSVFEKIKDKISI